MAVVAAVREHLLVDDGGVLKDVGNRADEDGKGGAGEEEEAPPAGDVEEECGQEDERNDLDVERHAKGEAGEGGGEGAASDGGAAVFPEDDGEQDEAHHHWIGVAVEAGDHDRGRGGGEQGEGERASTSGERCVRRGAPARGEE